jgi:hypothetical protein
VPTRIFFFFNPLSSFLFFFPFTQPLHFGCMLFSCFAAAVANASTGQLNRTRTARGSAHPLFDEVFHVRVKSPFDRVALHVLDRGSGHHTRDRRVGSADLPFAGFSSGNNLTRELSLPVRALDPKTGLWRTAGLLQVAAMWESQAVK